MNPKLRIFVGESEAGLLEKEPGCFSFRYHPEYDGPGIFLHLPVSEGQKSWDHFPPPFDGLLPEGQLLEQLLITQKLDRSDKWGQLKAVGADVTGFLSLLPFDSDLKPQAKQNPGQRIRSQSGIRPPADALPYKVTELITYHSRKSPRMSLSGVQPKVSAIYRRQDKRFEIVPQQGRYILKPSPETYPEAAENENLTLHLARLAGIQVPPCGFVRSLDGKSVFWIERFDRYGQANRIRIRSEDACQILEVPSSWKYHGNIETLVRLVRDTCSNPSLQLAHLYRRLLFCWISGNGDMHLKNWSLIENGPLIELAPAYDYLNTTILLEAEDESALSLHDQKNGFNQALLVDHLGRELCDLQPRMIDRILNDLNKIPWQQEIQSSDLTTPSKTAYAKIVQSRLKILGI